jgi:hypothetical protein
MTEYIIPSEPQLICLIKVYDPYTYQELANRQFRPLITCDYSLVQISSGMSVVNRLFALKPKNPI